MEPADSGSEVQKGKAGPDGKVRRTQNHEIKSRHRKRKNDQGGDNGGKPESPRILQAVSPTGEVNEAQGLVQVFAP